ncbi:carbon storage regulator CsrA [Kurthia senegalensis]|uniref:carbon storage regulator CsrA n=1 Tax=Kurthia senegalensis TaxID=1033740 RepID=UPI000289426B|nr:carbon storage regulator CsrA [Kurthia senegalensis]
MLVLTRKTGETLMLGDDIQVKVIGIDGDQVKIGIDAPKTLKIYRHEIFEAIQKENEAALNTNFDLTMLNDWE